MTKFSIMTGIDPAKPATDIVEYARATERNGFDALWIWGHLVLHRRLRDPHSRGC